MIDKMRLHVAGRLPADYVSNKGVGRPGLFDARCCRFLGVAYADLEARVLSSVASGLEEDVAVLAWCHEHGTLRSDEECEVWNAFMEKLGWRDSLTGFTQGCVRAAGLGGRGIESFFDFLDVDEERDPVVSRALNAPGEVWGIVLMGVAGCGKSTVGLALAGALGWGFLDADDFHPVANVKKMSSGVALTDVDRAPWLVALRGELERVRAGLGGGRGRGVVLACSALRESYRSVLLEGLRGVVVVYLRGEPGLLRSRLELRSQGGGGGRGGILCVRRCWRGSWRCWRSLRGRGWWSWMWRCRCQRWWG